MTSDNNAAVVPSESLFSSQAAYLAFECDVRGKTRYVRSPETEKFLKAVDHTSGLRIVTLHKGMLLWRAQLGHDLREEGDPGLTVEVPCPYSVSRMKPLLNRATEGRANPKGIPYLYLATTEKAAISEVRPWVGSYVSVGQFEIQRDLKIVNCSLYHSETPWYYFEDVPQDQWERYVWTSIDRAFAAPVTNTDDTADYAATQIIAELFRVSGNDGIAYRSQFGDDGYNVALFDMNNADLVACHLRKITKVDVTFQDESTSYFVKPN